MTINTKNLSHFKPTYSQVILQNVSWYSDPGKDIFKIKLLCKKSSLLNNRCIYILPIFGINAPYRFFFSLFFDWSFSTLLRWGMTNIIIPILQMKKWRHREAKWLAQGHQVCDQSGNSVANHLPTSFRKIISNNYGKCHTWYILFFN